MLKIVCIALICSLLIIYLKSINSELTFLATVGTGIILLILSVEYIVGAIEFINKLIDISGIDGELYTIIIKITAVGYLIEFAASTIQDFGLKSISDKLVFLGKLIILSMSFPILYAVFNMITGLIS